MGDSGAPIASRRFRAIRQRDFNSTSLAVRAHVARRADQLHELVQRLKRRRWVIDAPTPSASRREWIGQIGKVLVECLAERLIRTRYPPLVLRPQAQAFRRLGAMLSGLGRVDEAAATYEAWLRAEPGNPIAGHLLAACTGRGVPERGADAYVAAEFDRFADTFDSVLGKLEYRAPALVAAALRRACGEPRGDLDVVDAGCGTGLLAPYLRPYARRLAGVDLSPRMLEKAAARAVYDELRAAELTSYLASSPHAFDLVAASDTLNYFGDLAGVLAAAAGSLRPGGKLVFTLEHAPEEDPVPAGYRIHPDGRYMHSEAYLRKTLAAAGFEAPAIESGVLRREGDAYVRGLVVSARTPQRPEN